jgi:hypothetical protein
MAGPRVAAAVGSVQPISSALKEKLRPREWPLLDEMTWLGTARVGPCACAATRTNIENLVSHHTSRELTDRRRLVGRPDGSTICGSLAFSCSDR